MSNEYAVIITSEQAKARVMQSNLSQQDKKYFLNFIENFQDLEFYYNTTEALEEISQNQKISLPNSIKEYRETLGGVMFDAFPEFKFSKFDNFSPRMDDVSDTWYSINFSGFLSKRDREILTSNSAIKLYPFANASSGFNPNDLFFGIDLKNFDNQKIYEFHLIDIYDSYAEDGDILKSAYDIFESYAKMFSLISAIKYKKGKKEIIVKARES
jgi:hypothetical protein